MRFSSSHSLIAPGRLLGLRLLSLLLRREAPPLTR
jgi:hypothetical protein